ncbi:MAG: hypothetical protein A2848_03090 [Candidatus Magasanikbacteria bacterium RIFCSPHIGHO2_01_FULL_50_8]|uniref:Uncharacterized protein n=1 Tax=Candidatus Magasanikbacteria bacterium RIFCSPHIGHO2_01_FULL_50_8 TaxID=1798674 RepID=A0A1F6LUB7_9BACT|nr:MAG: hypothetical protein A2848_03090 [Candidatus Magasanikbacteria bacterium RIFCSPHIGHO2_01_FULL_50_8]
MRNFTNAYVEPERRTWAVWIIGFGLFLNMAALGPLFSIFLSRLEQQLGAKVSYGYYIELAFYTLSTSMTCLLFSICVVALARYLAPRMQIVWWPTSEWWVDDVRNCHRAWGLYWGKRLSRLYCVREQEVYTVHAVQEQKGVKVQAPVTFALKLRRPLKRAADALPLCELFYYLECKHQRWCDQVHIVALLQEARGNLSHAFLILYPLDEDGMQIQPGRRGRKFLEQNPRSKAPLKSV